jgi:electron transfer flavoprotein beta subunit
VVDVLVCIKRVPDTGGQITLTADASSLDTRSLGFTVSPHEECAVELAIQTAAATGGTATVLTLGPAEAAEQLRDALAVGCAAALHVEVDPAGYGPADVAAAIADVVTTRAADGRGFPLLLLGNDAADTGDFQVPVRLAYALDRPVVTGISTLSIAGDQVTARADTASGTDVFELTLPAVVAVMEGGVAPRYPSIPGRMKARRIAIETLAPSGEPHGGGRVSLALPEAPPSQVQILGAGADAAGGVVDLFERLGVLR